MKILLKAITFRLQNEKITHSSPKPHEKAKSPPPERDIIQSFQKKVSYIKIWSGGR